MMELKVCATQLFQSRIKDTIRLCTVIVGKNKVIFLKLVHMNTGQKPSYTCVLSILYLCSTYATIVNFFTSYIYIYDKFLHEQFSEVPL